MKMGHVFCVLLCGLFTGLVFAQKPLPIIYEADFGSPLKTRTATLRPFAATGSFEELCCLATIATLCPTSPIKGCRTTPPSPTPKRPSDECQTNPSSPTANPSDCRTTPLSPITPKRPSDEYQKSPSSMDNRVVSEYNKPKYLFPGVPAHRISSGCAQHTRNS